MFATALRTSTRRLSPTIRVAARCLTSGSSDGPHGAGAGFGNVRDQVLPTCRQTGKPLFQHSQYPKTVSLIGAPMTYGQPFVGTDIGPDLLKNGGLRSMLSSLGWRVEELDDVDFDNYDAASPPPDALNNNAKNSLIVGQGTLKLAKVVEETLGKGHFPLILGGDHSIGLGSLAAILKHRPDTGVIWVDAHADLNSPQGSLSGNMHGMPVGLLMDGVLNNLDDELPLGCEWVKEYPRLPADSIVYVGLRDVDAEERKLIRNLNIQAYTMTDIDRLGIGNVMDMAFKHLLKNDPDRPIHMSYDIDSIDPVLAPATGTTVRGGLTYREAHYVAESAAASGNLASFEIVELNPTLSDGSGAQETVDLGLQIITSALGKSII